MANQNEARKVAQYIAWFLGAFIGAGGGTVMLAPTDERDSVERIAVLESHYSHLEHEFREFKTGRESFTSSDGEGHDKRLAALERQTNTCQETVLQLKQRVWIVEQLNGRPE